LNEPILDEPSPKEAGPANSTVEVPNLVFLCTGNAARSVMAGCMMRSSGMDAHVVTAGTHVVENQPMSRRTRAALVSLGVDPGHHRSHQLTTTDISSADLIVAMAAEHVQYVRRLYPKASSRTATIAFLAANLTPSTLPLGARVAALALADADPEAQGDVADPAGGEEPEYVACAKEISVLMDQLLQNLGS
jgi:protein-tyrosine-phosphatase